jgi:hypothetical protein
MTKEQVRKALAPRHSESVYGIGADPPRARTHSERSILIDTLIHRYHWENVGRGGRPGACCLIEGKLKDIMPFLDALSYGEKTPDEVQATREEWRKEWRSSRWNRSRT